MDHSGGASPRYRPSIPAAGGSVQRGCSRRLQTLTSSLSSISSLSDATAFSVGWVIAAVIKTHLIPIAHPHIPRPASHTDAHARGVVVDDSLTPVVLHFPPALDYWPCL
jgi:hypothetical protein